MFTKLVPIEKIWGSSKFKKFVSWFIFGELHLTQASLTFKIFCCNLKIRGLGKDIRDVF